jgi:hypothetical protein
MLFSTETETSVGNLINYFDYFFPSPVFSLLLAFNQCLKVVRRFYVVEVCFCFFSTFNLTLKRNSKEKALLTEGLMG